MQDNKAKAAQMQLSRRIHTGKWLTAFEATIYFCAHTALLISTACFLWHNIEGNATMQ